MRKIAFIIIACLMGILAQAKEPKGHLKFMGIELNGSISDFQAKLLAKGLTVSLQSKLRPKGKRVFDGIFSGEDAQIIVWYNPRTKGVYRAKAIIYRYRKDLIEQALRSMERKLDAKYGIEYKLSEEVKDGNSQEFSQHSYLLDNGTIDLFVVTPDDSKLDDFSLHIDYQDMVNSKKNTLNEMDDL